MNVIKRVGRMEVAGAGARCWGGICKLGGGLFSGDDSGVLRVKRVAAVVAVLVVAGCGGGSGAGSTFVSPAPVQVMGMSSPRASQGLLGEALLAFRVSLDGATVVYPLEVSFTTSSTAVAGSSCTAGVDYYIPSGTYNGLNNTVSGKLTLTSSASSRQINMMVCPGNSGTDKVIQLFWGGGAAGGTATGTILGAGNADLTGSKRLNDTGISGCADGVSNGLSCPQAGFPGQDAELGRSATASVTGSGSTRTSAFSFSTLPSGGGIQDNVTGLLWEGKTTDGGLHDVNSTFTWLNSSAAVNGGAAGTAGAGVCTGVVPGGCDTEKFVAAVNAEKLYGFSDWRLPTVHELSTLINSGAGAGPAVDGAIVNQAAAEYWSATPKAGDSTGAWVVDFNSGAVVSTAKSGAKRVRLVRGR